MTGLGGSVGALRARQRIEAEVDRSRSGVTSTGHEIGARLPRAVGLGVKAEELKVLSCWIYSTTLQLATLFSGKLNLLVNCGFTSAPDCQLNLPLKVKPSLVCFFWG